jgi:CelD/BcsL family acetyltransferase involved in cellulose biosynthesis
LRHGLVLLRIRQTLREADLNLRLVLLQEIPEDPNLRQQWDALVQRVDQPQVFYTYEWSLAVQRAYHSTLRPLLFLAYDENQSLCGVASLAATADGRASFLCATTADYCDFVSRPECKNALVAGVLAELKKQGLNDIKLTNLPADSNTVAAIRKVSAQIGYRYFPRTAYHCAQVSLAKLERRPGEDTPLLPRKKMLRRFLNAMGRKAPVRLDHARSWDAVEPILPQFMQAHVARFLDTGRISNMARPERRVFLAELAKLLSPSGWLALTRMMSGDNSFAWNYGFEFQDTWFWYQPTFDSVLEKYSPGFCLLAKLIEEAANNPALRTIDLGLGAEEYKERFANYSRETLYVTLTTSPWRYAREILRYRAARTIKTYPTLEEGARTVFERWRQLKDSVGRDGVAATLQRLAKRAGAFFWSEDEVCFFEWSGPVLPDSSETLEPLDLNLLASATSRYVDDPSTLAYLLRSASRLRDGNAEGFCLVDAKGAPLHFAWVTAFDRFFLAELNAEVDGPSRGCAMIFDCWTPVSARGHGYYGQTVSRIARRVRDKGECPWIFSVAGNVASIRGLEKAGFQKRYSQVRQRALGLQRIKGETPKIEEPVGEVSTRV